MAETVRRFRFSFPYCQISVRYFGRCIGVLLVRPTNLEVSKSGEGSVVMISANAALPSSYDYGEVARSVLIAVAASYAGLDLAGRVSAARGGVRLAWLSGGATAMGIGVWAMHLKGMLAFRLPVSVAYHRPTILAALLVAIAASAVALYVPSCRKMSLV